MARPHRTAQETQQREDELLQLARGLLLEQGYTGLSMDRLAAASRYSKGTVYQHFTSREDFLAALATRSMRSRLELVRCALVFPGGSRERLLAVLWAGEVLMRRHPDYLLSERAIVADHVRERMTLTRRAALEAMENEFVALCTDAIREAVARGDVALPAGFPPERLFVSLWAIGRGLRDLAGSDFPIKRWLGDSFDLQLSLVSRLCDSFGWRPLSHEWDYHDSLQRIRQDAFPDRALATA